MSASSNHTAADQPRTKRGTACHCLAVRQAARRITQLYDHAMAPIGLRVTQFSMLAQLRDMGPVTMSTLAQRMVMDRATLGHNLRPLETQGLVERTVGTDRRSRLVTLTPLGQERLAQGWDLWREAQAMFEETFGKEEAAALRATLSRVAAMEFEATAS